METNKNFKYFAFISYKREDEEWAIWLQHELEYYHLPASLNGRDDLPKSFRPVFRDIDELKAGNLPEQIHEALASSLHLIVICSPRSAKSEWVNKEIEAFIEIGKEKGFNHLEHIFPFIVEGKPHSKDKEQECFPKALRDLPSDKERIGGNVNESGRDKAFIKILAGLLPNVSMDMLWNRYERDKAEEERKKREERDKLLIMQSRFISEKANELVEDGDSYMARRLLLEVLPKNTEHTERPCVLEAERTLRVACCHETAVLKVISGNLGNTAMFTQDDKRIISISKYNDAIQIFDTKTGKELKTVACPLSEVHSFDLSSDKKRIVLSSKCSLRTKDIQENTFRIFDVETGQELNVIECNSPVTLVAFSPDGRQVATASKDQIIRIWDAQSGTVLKSLDGCTAFINSIAFNPDGKKIVSTVSNTDAFHRRIIVEVSDSKILIWDIKSGKKMPIAIRHKGIGICKAVFSSSGKYIFSIDLKKRLIWNAETGKAVRPKDHAAIISDSSFCPNGNYATRIEENEVNIWNLKSGEKITTLKGHTNNVTSIDFSHDKKRIVTTSADNTIRIWELNLQNTSEKQKKQPNNCEEKESLSPSGKYKVTIIENNEGTFPLEQSTSVNILDNETKQIVWSLKADDECIFAKFIYDDLHILIVMLNEPTRILDWKDGEKTIELEDSAQRVNPLSLALSSDYTCIALAFWDWTINIWDSKSGQRIVSNLKGHAGNINSSAFSPDSKLLATASEDHTIRIWNMETKKELCVLRGHTSGVNSVNFIDKGARIISSSKDQTVRVWDIASNMLIQTFDGHTDINSIDFPPLQELIDQTRERFKDRPLTAEERRMYYLE